MADVLSRLLPHWEQAIAPDLRQGRTVFITAHSNSLRALIAHLEGLGPGELLDLHAPTAMPLAHELDADLRLVAPGGHHLEPERAFRAAAATARQASE